MLKTKYPKIRIKVVGNNLEQNVKLFSKKRSVDVYLFANTSALHSNQIAIQNLRSLIVVFDSPILLATIPNLLMLEYNANPDSNKFLPTIADYTPLFAAIEQEKKAKISIKINSEKLNVLPDIIKTQTVDGFFDKFNTFLYATTNVNNRTHIKNQLVRFIFGKLSVAELKDNIKVVGLEATKTKMLDEIIKYMEAEKGKKLQQALQEALKEEQSKKEASTKGRRTIAYKKIAEKYSIDKFDLHNLLLIGRTIL